MAAVTTDFSIEQQEKKESIIYGIFFYNKFWIVYLPWKQKKKTGLWIYI